MVRKQRKKRTNKYKSFNVYSNYLKKIKNSLLKKTVKYAFSYGNKNEKEYQLDMKLELYYKESQKRLKNLNESMSALKKREATLAILKEQLEHEIYETNLVITKLKMDEEKLAQLAVQEGQLLKEHGWITKKQKEQIEWFRNDNKKLSQFIHEEELLHIQSWKTTHSEKKQLCNAINLPISLKPCDTLLKQMDRWENIWIFEEDVDIIKYPSYLNVIKQPMSFSRCRQNLYNNNYKSLLHFAKDVNQIWENAKKFNPRGNKVHILADIYHKQFNKLLERAIGRQNQLEPHMLQKTIKLKLELKLFEKQKIENIPLTTNEINNLSGKLINLVPGQLGKVMKLVKKYQCLELGNINLKRTIDLKVLPISVLRQLQELVKRFAS